MYLHSTSLMPAAFFSLDSGRTSSWIGAGAALMNCRGSDDPAARVNAAGACMASGGNRCSCNESHHKVTAAGCCLAAAAMTPSCESCNALLASTSSFCRSWSATSTPPLASLCFTVCCYYVVQSTVRVLSSPPVLPNQSPIS